jgi:alcohol dehydrogenase
VAAALAATAPGGTAIAIGLPPRGETIAVSPFELVATERTLRGSFMGSAVPRRDIPRYVSLWRSGRLPVDRLVSGTFGLDDLNEAVDRLANGEVVRSICVGGERHVGSR